jgi:hypothetical protein
MPRRSVKLLQRVRSAPSNSAMNSSTRLEPVTVLVPEMLFAGLSGLSLPVPGAECHGCFCSFRKCPDRYTDQILPDRSNSTKKSPDMGCRQRIIGQLPKTTIEEERRTVGTGLANRRKLISETGQFVMDDRENCRGTLCANQHIASRQIRRKRK